MLLAALVALLVAVASYRFIVWYFGSFSDDRPPPEALRTLQRVIYATNQWAWIVAPVCLRPADLAPLVEGPLLLAITAAACAATYEIAKRVGGLRPLLGLKRAPAI